MKPQRVVESHVHFWVIQLLDYHWLQREPVLHRSYLPSDLVRAAPAYELDKPVCIQADCLPTQSMAEAAWVESISVSEPDIKAQAPHPWKEHLADLADHPKCLLQTLWHGDRSRS